MKQTIMSLLLLTIFVAAVGGTARADVPEKFTNLKVLPGDISKPELVGIMRGFSGALGMSCTGCHVEQVPGDRNSIDWASDKLKDKDVARGMMKMVQEINGNLLPAATGEHDFQVRCITCHRGVGKPETLDRVLLKVIDRDGVAAGETRYRELREEYYGTGSYDFSPMTLSKVAEVLAQENSDLAAARSMVLLNLEMTPDDADSYVMLAQLDLAGGDKDAARAGVEKALALEPDNRHAKRLLQQIDQ